MKTSNELIQELLKAEEEAEEIIHKAKESKMHGGYAERNTCEAVLPLALRIGL